MARTEESALVVFIACNLLFTIWLWQRARPGSNDRTILPTIMLMSVSMLVGILPRVLWPNAERVKIAGSIASMILSVVAVIVGVRRTLRRAGAQNR
jgi:predicted small integral membrane protein